MLYKSIFNINIHHAFFLDDGTSKFLDMTDDEKDVQLLKYNLSEFMMVTPMPASKSTLRNHRMLWRKNPHGIRVLVSVIDVTIDGDDEHQPIIPFADDLALVFEVRASDPFFNNYSNLEDINSHRLYHFTNKKLSTEGGGFANIFTGDGIVDEDYLLSEQGSRLLIHSLAVTGQLNNTVIGTDAITSIPDTDLGTTEAQKILNAYIEREKKNGLLGFVTLHVKGDSDNDLLLYNDDDPNDIKQYLPEDAPSFTLHMVNRSTFWRYIQEKENLSFTTEEEKPLTKNGFVEIVKEDLDPEPSTDLNYPNPDAHLIKLEDDNNYYSEIFI
ncbi:hypothetical protein ACFQ1M_05795 [Sungkyunkwania multivorans]|uniref:Uncharacterized protein n=1 Tax=Sungkyunkwania multivorans TaxID=1173618 RepID=A0ABW3CVB5_9FLAO